MVIIPIPVDARIGTYHHRTLIGAHSNNRYSNSSLNISNCYSKREKALWNCDAAAPRPKASPTIVTISAQKLHGIAMLHRRTKSFLALIAIIVQKFDGIVIQHRQKQNLPNTTCEWCRSFEANPKLSCTYHNAYANASWNCDAATQESKASSQHFQ